MQFVVITLIAEMPIPGADAQAGGAFSTPSVVHFGAVLLLSAIVSAPWTGIAAVAVLWGLMGLCGLGYTAVVVRRMRVQTAHQPVFEDWLFHVGAAALLLLIDGIHNAWDAVMYHVFVGKLDRRESEPRP